MRGWSLPVGRYFGVEVRIHAFFFLLLAMALTAGALGQAGSGRIFTLWIMLLFFIAARELVRAIVALWLGLELRLILLLPTGGVLSYATLQSSESATQPRTARAMALAGPIASFALALLLALIVLASAPGFSIVEKPRISPDHLLRAAIWLNVLLGLVNLVPFLSLAADRLFAPRSAPGAPDGLERRSPAETPSALATFRLRFGGVGQWAAMALIVAGLVGANLWLIVLGAFVLIGSNVERHAVLAQNESDPVRMRDVMLTQFSTLSASDTLEDALQRAVHTMQDVFPVVRGGILVGAVSRQSIIESLTRSGNSYVQGVMTRTFYTASPDDSLVKTLRRIMGTSGAQLVPVMEGERILGIVTPQNLSQSMGLIHQSRRLRRNDSR